MKSPRTGHILIADDDAAFRRLVGRVLEERGYTFDEASTGGELRQRLQERPYDVLLSDLDMPGNRQLEALTDIPQIQAGLPVLIITGAPTMESAIQCIRLSVTAYLLKPVMPAELVKEVDNAVERHGFLRAIVRSRERLQRASAELERLEDTWIHPGAAGIQASVQAYLTVSFEQAAHSLGEVRRVLELLNSDKTTLKLDPAGDPLRVLALLQTLAETVSVLERTKNSFKSRELGDLRHKIEELLKNVRKD